MTREQLDRTSTPVVLRLRSDCVRELRATPEHLYPLLHGALHRRLLILNSELSRRAGTEPELVELVEHYDAAAPLEHALRPQRPLRRG